MYRKTRDDAQDDALSNRWTTNRDARPIRGQAIGACDRENGAGGRCHQVTGSRHAAAAGVAVQAAGKGLEYGNKAVFQCIDWHEAAKAAKTLDLARAGSHQAMQVIFKDHQKYATMYICWKAHNGDARSQVLPNPRARPASGARQRHQPQADSPRDVEVRRSG